MSDKRKADFTILLKKQGKKSKKIEVFNERQFKGRDKWGCRFRVRVNGKWFSAAESSKNYFTWYEIRDMFWRSLGQFRL